MEDTTVRGSDKNKMLVVCGVTSCSLWIKQRILGLGWEKDETVVLKACEPKEVLIFTESNMKRLLKNFKCRCKR